MTTTLIRPMRVSDLPQVLKIQALCYTGVAPESRESLEAKLAACPLYCFIASLRGETVGYLFALLWRSESPPALNEVTCVVPESPDCLYLHDLAVLPKARSAGVGRALVERFFAALKDSGMRRASLIAVQNSAPYWGRFGFTPAHTTDRLRAKLATYGEAVVYMMCPRS